MQVTSERSDNVKYGNNVGDSEKSAANTVAYNMDVETAKAVLTAQENVVKSLDEITLYVNELRRSVDNLAKAQYALVTLYCFVCLSLFALVIILSLAFL